MSFWVLTSGCQVLSRTTVQRVTNLELQTQDIADRCREYDLAVAPRIDDPDYDHDPDGNGKTNPRDWETEFTFDDAFHEDFFKVVSDEKRPETDKQFTPDVNDNTYLNMELACPVVEER